MAERGWSVFGGVRSDDASAELIQASSGAVTPIICDVTSSQQFADATTRVLSRPADRAGRPVGSGPAARPNRSVRLRRKPEGSLRELWRECHTRRHE
jgi:hypothetical protein